jgi:DNA polymerase V
MHQLVVNNLPDKATLLRPAAFQPFALPLYPMAASYSTWPSAAQDYLQEELDINEYLIGPRKASVFLFRITGSSMRDAGILQDDIIVVDRSLEVQDGHIVVASIFGEFTCKYYRKNADGVFLVPANPDFQPKKVTPEMEFTVFGRYDGLIRKNSGRNREPFSLPFA